MRPNSNQNNNNKNRQRGRNGGRKHVNPLSRNFESNGPDVKVRGNASHVAEKYLQLARDAQSSGDSVMAENYLQHAEHYFRIVAAAQLAQSGQRPDGQSQDDADYDDDMPEMNSRFSSPQPQQQFVQPETDEQPEMDRSEQQPQQQQRQDRPEREQRRDRQERPRQTRPEGERQVRPEGEIAAVAQPVAAPVAAAGADEAGEQPVLDGEVRKPRERRPRRRRPAGGDGGDLAGADQPDVGELPAFLTAGSTNPAE